MNVSEVIIERLALGGSGVGRVNGKVCFVPFSAPGDRLKVRVMREHRSYCEAELVEVCDPSPDRVEPRCPVFGSCGGCDWQHIKYAHQCSHKRQILVETLQRVARMSSPQVAETLASEQPFGYRARAQFKLHQTRSGLAIGFYRRNTRSAVDLPQGCPVVTPAINSAIQKLREVLQKLPDLHHIPQVNMEEGQAGVVATVQYNGSDQQRLSRLLLERRGDLGLAGFFLQTGRKGKQHNIFGDDYLSYSIPCYGGENTIGNLGYKMGGFSQVNRGQNRRMVQLVSDYSRPDAHQRLLDLYCGNGNLSLPLAGMVKEVVGIEEFPSSIASAVDNARQLRVNNSTFRCNDAAQELRQLLQQQEPFDLVLLDPPRAGAAELISNLVALSPKRIVYVSCDPATLARDLAGLCEGTGYLLEEATPLDMFPQTAHLETVALLTKQ